jgi:LemA protein
MWIVGTVLILVVGAGVLIFNRLVKARNLVDEAWSGVDVQLKRRHDLVPNLVESVKGYTEHEHTLFDQIAQQRTKAIDGNPQTNPEDENALTRQIKTLFAVAEAYPDLKANQNFLDLQKKLVEIEDALQYARRYYNGTVRDYNILVESFPSNIVASRMSYHTDHFFEIEYATERNAPDIAFNKT